MPSLHSSQIISGIVIDADRSFPIGAGVTPLINGLLDVYPADMAYSLARLRANQILCCRVRRSSDNAEQNFGFAYSETFGGWWVDHVAILAFVGAGDGFVTVLHDQSGNGRHLVCSNASYQPQIVISGVLVVAGVTFFRPSIYFGHQKYLTLLDVNTFSFPSGTQDCAAFITASANDSATYVNGKLFEMRNAGKPLNRARWVLRISGGTNRRPQSLAAPFGDIGGTGVVTSQILNGTATYNDWFWTFCQITSKHSISTSNPSTLRRNGVASLNTTANGNLGFDSSLIDCFTLGGNAATYEPYNDCFEGYISEAIFYNGDMSANMAAIEADQQTRYSVT